jgi:HAD superfamily hydrolase (TIGR01509 family)
VPFTPVEPKKLRTRQIGAIWHRWAPNWSPRNGDRPADHPYALARRSDGCNAMRGQLLVGGAALSSCVASHCCSSALRTWRWAYTTQPAPVAPNTAASNTATSPAATCPVASANRHGRLELVRTLSDDAPADVQDRLSDAHSRYYRETASLPAPLPGARALLRRVAGHGLQAVLASSAPDDELEILRKVLGCDDVIGETTSSRGVHTAKPEPGIMQVALDRAGVNPDQAVFVGDAGWDAHAAAGTGLPCIGLLSGGIAHAELQAAGASPIFADPQDLLDHLEFTRIAALAPSR